MIQQLIESGYLVIHREEALRLMSESAYRELLQAVETSLKKSAAVPLSSEETKEMEDYFASRSGLHSDKCPLCGSAVIHQGGCLECADPSCGWAACG